MNDAEIITKHNDPNSALKFFLFIFLLPGIVLFLSQQLLPEESLWFVKLIILISYLVVSSIVYDVIRINPLRIESVLIPIFIKYWSCGFLVGLIFASVVCILGFLGIQIII